MALHTQPLQPEYQHTEPLGGRVRYCPKRKRLRTLITLNSACTWAWGWSCAALEGFHVGLGKVDRPQFSFLQIVLGQTHPLNQSKRGPGWAPVLLVCRGAGVLVPSWQEGAIRSKDSMGCLGSGVFPGTIQTGWLCTQQRHRERLEHQMTFKVFDYQLDFAQWGRRPGKSHMGKARNLSLVPSL